MNDHIIPAERIARLADIPAQWADTLVQEFSYHGYTEKLSLPPVGSINTHLQRIRAAGAAVAQLAGETRGLAAGPELLAAFAPHTQEMRQAAEAIRGHAYVLVPGLMADDYAVEEGEAEEHELHSVGDCLAAIVGWSRHIETAAAGEPAFSRG